MESDPHGSFNAIPANENLFREIMRLSCPSSPFLLQNTSTDKGGNEMSDGVAFLASESIPFDSKKCYIL